MSEHQNLISCFSSSSPPPLVSSSFCASHLSYSSSSLLNNTNRLDRHVNFKMKLIFFFPFMLIGCFAIFFFVFFFLNSSVPSSVLVEREKANFVSLGGKSGGRGATEILQVVVPPNKLNEEKHTSQNYSNSRRYIQKTSKWPHNSMNLKNNVYYRTQEINLSKSEEKNERRIEENVNLRNDETENKENEEKNKIKSVIWPQPQKVKSIQKTFLFESKNFELNFLTKESENKSGEDKINRLVDINCPILDRAARRYKDIIFFKNRNDDFYQNYIINDDLHVGETQNGTQNIDKLKKKKNQTKKEEHKTTQERERETDDNNDGHKNGGDYYSTEYSNYYSYPHYNTDNGDDQIIEEEKDKRTEKEKEEEKEGRTIYHKMRINESQRNVEKPTEKESVTKEKKLNEPLKNTYKNSNKNNKNGRNYDAQIVRINVLLKRIESCKEMKTASSIEGYSISFDEDKSSYYYINKNYDTDLHDHDNTQGSSTSQEKGENWQREEKIRQLMENNQGEKTYGSENNYVITIEAEEVWGVLYALETLSQMTRKYANSHPKKEEENSYYTQEKGDKNKESLPMEKIVENELKKKISKDENPCVLVEGVNVVDYPRFRHRGLLLDTSRHYIHISIIKRHLELMSMNKFNVLHWHLIDDQSFPLQSYIYKNLTETGAYFPKTFHIYTQEQIRYVIFYALNLGIRVMVEIDTPAHTSSWKGLSKNFLTECYDEKTKQPNGSFGPINPIVNGNYYFLKNIFKEIYTIFPESYIHLGGDECDFSCWMSNPHIKEFMQKNNFGGAYRKLENFYFTKLFNVLKEIDYEEEKNNNIIYNYRSNDFYSRIDKKYIDTDNSKKQKNSYNDDTLEIAIEGKTPKNRNITKSYVVWQDTFDEQVTFPEELKENIIIQIWFGDYKTEMKKILNKKYKMILSSCWYLDLTSYGADWKNYYRCEPVFFSLQEKKDEEQQAKKEEKKEKEEKEEEEEIVAKEKKKKNSKRNRYNDSKDYNSYNKINVDYSNNERRNNHDGEDKNYYEKYNNNIHMPSNNYNTLSKYAPYNYTHIAITSPSPDIYTRLRSKKDRKSSPKHNNDDIHNDRKNTSNNAGEYKHDKEIQETRRKEKVQTNEEGQVEKEEKSTKEKEEKTAKEKEERNTKGKEEDNPAEYFEEELSRYVIGGEGCLWGEFIDGTNLIPVAWPRASAISEKLWSSYEDTKTLNSFTEERFANHRCKMVLRGYPAAPGTGPSHCYQEYYTFS